MSKTMCKLSPKDDYDKFIEEVKSPKFYCKSCGRVAAKEKRLCKPEEIPHKKKEQD